MVGRISSPRFVGRVAELDVLQRALARASSGTGTAVLVAGEAGIGKSRLVSEIEVWARAREALVLIGECVELAEGELAFAPIISALRGVIEDGGALEGIEGPMRSALGALWPVAGADVGVDTGREQLFEAVYRVLARLAQEHVVLLIVEDVHWIDPSSRDLLTLLVRNARHDRIAMVATYRPDELHRGHPLRPFIAELERSGRAERVELEPLERSEVAEQLEAIVGRAPGASVVDGSSSGAKATLSSRRNCSREPVPVVASCRDRCGKRCCCGWNGCRQQRARCCARRQLSGVRWTIVFLSR